MHVLSIGADLAGQDRRKRQCIAAMVVLGKHGAPAISIHRPAPHTFRRAAHMRFIPCLFALIQLSVPLTAHAQTVRFTTTDWPYGGGAFTSFVQAADGCIYATDRSLGLFRSCTEGRSWSTMRDARGMPVTYPSDTYIDRETGRLLVLSSGRPMQLLEVTGAPWRPIEIDADDRPVQFESADGAITVYAMSASSIYRSDDVGESWTRVYSSSKPLQIYGRPLVADGRRAQLLYLASGTSIVRSTDGGTTWVRTIDSLWTATRPLLTVARGGAVLAANESGVVLRSSDSGFTWTHVAGATAGIAVGALTTSRAGTIYIGNDNGDILESVDSGKTFKQIDYDLIGKRIDAIHALPGGAIIAAVPYDSSSIIRRDKGNFRWEFSAYGISSLEVGRLVVDNRGQLFAPIVGSNTYYRALTGEGWLGDTIGLGGHLLRCMGTTPQGTLLAGLAGRGVAFLSGGAWTMSPTDFGSPQANSADGFAWGLNNRVWAATGSGVFQSDDDGGTWAGAMQGLNISSVGVRSDGMILLGTGKKTSHELVYRSADNGYTFETSNSGVTEAVRAITFLSTGEPVIATRNGLMISRDDGSTWQSMRVDSADTEFVAVIADHHGSIFAATSNMVYVSRDNGDTWDAAYQGLSGAVRDLAIDSSGVLYVATYGAGVFRSQSAVSAIEREPIDHNTAQRSVLIVRDAEITIPLHAASNALVAIEIFSATGSRVCATTVDRGTHSYVTLPSTVLANGVYLVNISYGSRLDRLTVLMAR